MAAFWPESEVRPLNRWCVPGGFQFGSDADRPEHASPRRDTAIVSARMKSRFGYRTRDEGSPDRHGTVERRDNRRLHVYENDF